MNISDFIIENKLTSMTISGKLELDDSIDIFLYNNNGKKYKSTRITTTQNQIIQFSEMFIDLKIPFLLQGYWNPKAFIFANDEIFELENLFEDNYAFDTSLKLVGHENEKLKNSFMQYKLLWNV